MKKFLYCLYATFFIFFVGNGVVAIPLTVGDYIWQWGAMEEIERQLKNSYGLLIVMGIGIFSVALAIYDGEFVSGYVKDKHWIHRR